MSSLRPMMPKDGRIIILNVNLSNLLDALACINSSLIAVHIFRFTDIVVKGLKLVQGSREARYA